MSQQPSLGRVVLVLVDPTMNNGSDVAPATITRVFSKHPDGGWTVNVKVHLDASGELWKTSVRLLDDEAAVRAMYADARYASGAFWPPRVG